MTCAMAGAEVLLDLLLLRWNLICDGTSYGMDNEFRGLSIVFTETDPANHQRTS